MAVTQTISVIPQAGKRGVDTREVFVTKQENFQDTLTDTTVTQLNTAFGQINTTETNINNKEASAASSANTATTKAGEAVASAALSQNWAISETLVDATDKGAKGYSLDSKEWATSETLVDGVHKGAKGYALEAQAAVATLPDGTLNDAQTTLTNTWSASKIDTEKQATLVSGTNIKSINGESLVGSGNIVTPTGTKLLFDKSLFGGL